MIRVTFTNLPKGINQAKLRTAARITYKMTGLRVSGEVHVAFVSKATSKKLNKDYAHKAYATDVLSFSYVEEATTLPSGLIGDIAICTPIAKISAKKHGISLQNELTLMLVHGILHIIGFDHDKKVAKTSFGALQNAIMKELQLTARPYLYDHT